MIRPTFSRGVFIVAVIVAFESRAAAIQDDPVFSGPQRGEKVAPFRVLQFAGPDAGKEVELAAADRAGPTMLVFVHEVTRPAMQLLRPIDLYATKLAPDGLATHFVWLTADRSRTEQFLSTARNSLAIKSPVDISLDGIEGPGSYGLNRKVTLTILLAKDHKVAANFAIVQPNETDAPKILAEMAKLMGKPSAPSLEELAAELGSGQRAAAARPAASARLDAPQTDSTRQVAELSELLRQLQKQVGDLTDALNEARAKVAKLEGSPAPEPLKKPAPPPAANRRESTERKTDDAKKDGANLPGRTPSDPEIVGLMRRMIQPTNDEATVKDVTAAMLKWAGDDATRKDDLKQFCVRIAHLGYGSDAAKVAIKRFAERN